MKSVIVIFAAMMMILVTPAFFVYVDDVLTDDLTLAYNSTSVPAGQTAVNFTLSEPLYNDNIANVVEVSSNLSTDVPTAYSYNEVSYALEVSGLTANTTSTFTVEYLTDTDNTDQVVFWTTIRWLWVLVITALIGGSVYAFFTS